LTPQQFVPWLWAGWIVSWWLAAVVRNRTVARPTESSVGYRVLPAIGAILLFVVRPSGTLSWLTWHSGAALGWTMVGVAVAGFAFTWWARIHLGRLWSANVTRKEHHRVVDSGPYRLVRHPIYTGIDVAAFATSAIAGSVVAVLGAAVMAYGFYYKARIEERFLTKELGADYAAYARRTPMLIPFTRSRSSAD
jgi:protein-S-isoprenylcysteine O-methyltransferase Ste14